MTTVYRCYVASPSFDFEAYGATDDEARAALRAAIYAHAAQYGADPDWADDAILDSAVYPITLGAGYRDAEYIATAECDCGHVITRHAGPCLECDCAKVTTDGSLIESGVLVRAANECSCGEVIR